MIVVILVGTIYGLVLSNFHNKKKVHILKIENIKEALQPFWSNGKRLDFYIYDACKKSALFSNDHYQEELKPDIALSEFDSIEALKPDITGENKTIEFPPIMINNRLHKVCFAYTLFPNGSNSSYIVKKDKMFYVFYPYFQDVNKSESLSEAKAMLTHKPYQGVSIDEIHE